MSHGCWPPNRTNRGHPPKEDVLSADPSIASVPAFLAADTSVPLLRATVGDLLDRAIAAAPERVALIAIDSDGTERSWTYVALRHDARQLAAALLSSFEPGDRVATLAASSAEILHLYLGAALAGITLVTLNPASKAGEVEYMLRQCDARGVILDRRFRGVDHEALLSEVRLRLDALSTVVWTDEWDAFLATGRDHSALPTVDPDTPALILFTSGTTGKAKGAVLTHNSIVNNAFFGSARYQLPDGAVWLSPLPLFHVGGSVTATLACISRVGTQVLMSGFDADRTLAALHTLRVNIMLSVPTMLVAMLQSPRLDEVDLSALEIVVTGATVVAPELVRQVAARMNVETMVMFGQTETGGAVTLTRRHDPIDRVTETIGAPIAHTDCKIIDTATGLTVLRGVRGEICVRSPCLMREYFAMPEMTADTIDTDGWVHTGDLGLMRDDGYLQITGRMKDMIIRGGENVYPREIEDVLAEHPAVAQAAVYGVPDERYGEQVAVALTIQPGAHVEVAELTEFVGARLSRHKVPLHWRIVDEFPMNASGKIQKFLLLEQFEQFRRAQ